jgi:hypothetical protein
MTPSVEPARHPACSPDNCRSPGARRVVGLFFADARLLERGRAARARIEPFAEGARVREHVHCA